MRTAVEFLIKEFSDMLGPLDIKPMQDLLLVDAIKRAKEMHKEEIFNAINIVGIKNAIKVRPYGLCNTICFIT
jgi:hypothetical protein